MGQIWGPGMRVPGMPWDRVRRGYPGIRGLGRSGGSKYGVQIWGPKIDHYLDVFNRDELGDFRISDFGGLRNRPIWGPEMVQISSGWILHGISHFDIMQSWPFGGLQNGSKRARGVPKGPKRGSKWGISRGTQESRV